MMCAFVMSIYERDSNRVLRRGKSASRADTSIVRALSIRQPYGELILRGIKTAELRSRATTIVGERFYIYACKSKAKRPPPPIWSDDLRLATPPPPLWMIELAEQVGMIPPGELAALPRGVIVGSAVIERVTPCDQIYRWHLSDVRRLPRPRKPRRQPQPAWFTPF